ncbi:hypothetical protein FN846DRAFT_143204 [Sphaerosporella brunnea]|uniref:Uncharacterized protein n=1 Tax=Sphaerosporella brunnea TaxID=1250544 RepID=A0A5J5ERH1_9PEZI|nr:hypothetical protein FN846DRAFT_143204 [Sphaerosporella brunnea]
MNLSFTTIISAQLLCGRSLLFSPSRSAKAPICECTWHVPPSLKLATETGYSALRTRYHNNGSRSLSHSRMTIPHVDYRFSRGRKEEAVAEDTEAGEAERLEDPFLPGLTIRRRRNGRGFEPQRAFPWCLRQFVRTVQFSLVLRDFPAVFRGPELGTELSGFCGYVSSFNSWCYPRFSGSCSSHGGHRSTLAREFFHIALIDLWPEAASRDNFRHVAFAKVLGSCPTDGKPCRAPSELECGRHSALFVSLVMLTLKLQY